MIKTGKSTENSARQTTQQAVKTEAKDALIYFAATFIRRFGSFLIIPAILRFLMPAEFAVIALAEVVLMFSSTLLNLSLEQAVNRFYYEWPAADRPSHLATLWMASQASVLGLGSLITVGLIAWCETIFAGVNARPYLPLIIFQLFLNSSLVVPLSVIRIKRLPRLFLTVSILSCLSDTLIGWTLLFVLDDKLLAYFSTLTFTLCFSFIFCTIFMFRSVQFHWRSKALRESLRFSVPLIPAQAITNLASILDRLILQRFSTPANLGLYAATLKFTNIVDLLHGATKLGFVPFLVKNISEDRKAGNKLVSQMTPIYILPLLIAAITLSLFVEDVIRLIGASEYQSLGAYVPLFVVPVLFSTLNLYLNPGLFLAKRSDLMIIPPAALLVITLSLGMTLTPTLGVLGILIAKAVGSVVVLTLSYFMTKKYFPTELNWMVICTCLALCLFSAAFGAAFPEALGFKIALYVVAVMAVMRLALGPLNPREALFAMVKRGKKKVVPPLDENF